MIKAVLKSVGYVLTLIMLLKKHWISLEMTEKASLKNLGFKLSAPALLLIETVFIAFCISCFEMSFIKNECTISALVVCFTSSSWYSSLTIFDAVFMK